MEELQRIGAQRSLSICNRAGLLLHGKLQEVLEAGALVRMLHRIKVQDLRDTVQALDVHGRETALELLPQTCNIQMERRCLIGIQCAHRNVECIHLVCRENNRRKQPVRQDAV